jgi:hypothetical protein
LSIVKGTKARRKLIRITELSIGEIQARLTGILPGL